MNKMISQLNMTQSSFVDPAGINDENISTARDITKVSIAASFHPNMQVVSGADYWRASIDDGQEQVYNSTNKMLWRKVDWLVAKTGYTNTARAGFTGVYLYNGRRIAITTLGAWYPFRRWKDVNALMNWVAKH
jgi:D-alanyl-D-alanine endopeptidase (penicillin-binding protein 7)